MKRQIDKKEGAKKNKEHVSDEESFSDEEEPKVVATCQEGRAKRATTQQSTKESKATSYGGSKPVERERRVTGDYSNVEKHKEFGQGNLKRETLDIAIRKKHIWSGNRGDVSWETDFPSEWWTAQADANDEWACSHKFPGYCHQPNPAPDHSNLEIGHIQGFYTIMHELFPKIVCDGKNHWEIYLFDDVVKKNQSPANLNPQCKGCNRHPSQQKKDERGLGNFSPVDKGACPNIGSNCDEQYKIDLDGDLNG